MTPSEVSGSLLSLHGRRTRTRCSTASVDSRLLSSFSILDGARTASRAAEVGTTGASLPLPRADVVQMVAKRMREVGGCQYSILRSIFLK